MSTEPTNSVGTRVILLQQRVDKLEHAICTLIEKVESLERANAFQTDQIAILHGMIHAKNAIEYVDELQLSDKETNELDEMFGGST